MRIEIQIVREPIRPDNAQLQLGGGGGALVEFTGVVRAEEDGRKIAALEYEAYDEMALRVMRQICESLAMQQPCDAVVVVHRIGIIPVGAAAIFICAAAKHRAEAFALVTGFMDRLKQDVPIWKRRAIPLDMAGDDVSSLALPPPGKQMETPHVVTLPHLDSSRPATVDETLALIHECSAALDVVQIPLVEAEGRVLREPVLAPEDQPPFDRSAVDGFAIRLDDAAKRFQIVDRIRAGDWRPRQLQPSEAAQIATGGALPAENLQVVMKEDVRVAGDEVEILRRDNERNIRFRGEDARAGSQLIAVGTRLEPGALALLASIGQVQPLVTRLPRVLHVATGDEIVPPGQTPRTGQIRDSNSTLVRAFMEQRGIVPEQVRVGEARAEIDSALRAPHFVFGPDLLLISGGASVGEHDFTRSLLADLGYTIRISRTTTRPGKPLIFATRGGAVAFGLPGNPLAHFVCLHLYVRAALHGFSGGTGCIGFAEGVLAEEFIPGSNVRETLWPARIRISDASVQLTPLPWRSSGDLTSLAAANALVRIPPGSGRLAPGAKLWFQPTAPWL